MINLSEIAASVENTASAVSESNINLLLNPTLNSNFFLSPTSAYTTKFNSQKRRNSYTPASTINENYSMIIPNNSSQKSSSTHFLNPNITTMYRRRLPLTPIIDEKDSYMINSSPRILPTPPSYSPTTIPFYNNNLSNKTIKPQLFIKQIDESLSNNFNYSNQLLIERRPSTGRRLPPEPNTNLNNHNKNNNNNLQLDNENYTLINNNNFLPEKNAFEQSLQQFQNK